MPLACTNSAKPWVVTRQVRVEHAAHGLEYVLAGQVAMAKPRKAAATPSTLKSLTPSRADGYLAKRILALQLRQARLHAGDVPAQFTQAEGFLATGRLL